MLTSSDISVLKSECSVACDEELVRSESDDVFTGDVMVLLPRRPSKFSSSSRVSMFSAQAVCAVHGSAHGSEVVGTFKMPWSAKGTVDDARFSEFGSCTFFLLLLPCTFPTRDSA